MTASQSVAPTAPKIAVFSDLHLLNAPPATDLRNQIFAQTLRYLREDEHITELWLLGDIFDLMIGPYRFWPNFHAEIFSEFKALVRAGVKVLWIEGNHDFYLGHFAKKFGFQMHEDDWVETIGGQKFFLSHGDLVNQNDTGYLKWRAHTRGWRFRAQLKFLPNFLARRFLLPWAEARSSDSRQKSGHGVAPALTELFRDFAQKKMDEGFRGVFLGHGHHPELWMAPDDAFYLNLGSWLKPPYRYALWAPNQEKFPTVKVAE